MKRWGISELINLDVLQKMVDNFYDFTKVTIVLCDVSSNIVVRAGREDICTKFHRMHPITNNRCKISDDGAKKKLAQGEYLEYKCLNNIWEVALPIVVRGQYIGTLFVCHFFYEDEIVDLDFFKKQAKECGFDEEEYLSELRKLPVFSRENIKHILEYYKGLVTTLVESSMAKLQHMETEEKLRKSEARIRNFLESTRDTIIVLDKEGNLLEYYNSLDSSTFLPPKELIGINNGVVCNEHIANLYKNAINELQQGKFVNFFEYSVGCGESMLWYSSLISKVKDVDGEPDMFIAVIREITDKKEHEKELIKAKSEAEAANNVKNNFIANMSHELRTPINVILSAMQLSELNEKMMREGTSYDNRHNKAIKQNCFRLLRLINNIIDITKIDAGFMNLHLKNLNVINLIEDITMSVVEYAKVKDINVLFDTEVEERIAALDPDKIERIILNLLSNAIKCTKAGGSIFVNIYDNATSIKVSIKDTGRGIPDDKIDGIFNRFIQVEDTLIKSHEGSGIGLSIVKSFVEMQGGTISVKSQKDIGTEFIIEFPVHIVDDKTEKNFTNVENNNFVETLEIEFSDIYV